MARGPVESPDSLRSRQYARIIDLIGEGELEGLVGLSTSTTEAEKSIYLDGVAMRNESGTPNFDLEGLTWEFVPGTQAQAALTVGGTINSEIAVGQEFKYGNTGGGPVVRSIAETYIDACRVTVSIPRLAVTNTSNGNTSGTTVQFAIDLQNNGGGYVEVMQKTITGKTSSEYQQSYEFDLPAPGPWDIRLRRITLDSTAQTLANQTEWSTYTKIVKDKLSYPNTALIGLKVDSALFDRIPPRAYRMRLLKIQVPVNYDPATRVYTGMWNGTFKTAWTGNPAWCWYDLATKDRYGLGQYLDPGSIDKWTLYEIAEYCDELVSDGFGGTEPRFTCNLLLQKREEALKVLMNFASIFRGIAYWHTNSVFCSQDRPGDPVKLFTPANVIDGEFSYSGTARRARHTVAHVSWNDPQNLYKQDVEYVEDREGVARLGVQEVEITAMGCTSRGQAHRMGLWTLLTEREETDTITFSTGIEGAGVMPGEIIQTTDPARAGKRYGGRILGATSTTIDLDSSVTLEVGKTYTVSVLLPSGVVEEKAVVWGGGSPTDYTTLTLASALADVPQDHAVWILSANDLVPELWRVMGIVEDNKGQLQISAMEHVPGKYAAVEQGLLLEPRPTSVISVIPGAVTNVVAETQVKQLNTFDYSTRIAVSWTPPDTGAARYFVSWRRDAENPGSRAVTGPSIDIDDVPAGSYEIGVTAYNAIGRRGPTVTITHDVDESGTAPDVANLRLNPAFDDVDCPITWDRVDGATSYQVDIYDDATLLRSESVSDPWYTYTYSRNLADGGPRREVTFKVKAHILTGQSANFATLLAQNPAPATPVGLVAEAGPGQVGVLAQRPGDADLVGMIVWMHTSASFTPTDTEKIYQGADNAYMKTGLQSGVPMYFKMAFFDRFGVTGLNISTSIGATPLATGGIEMVTSLPANPAAVGDQLAVFLDVVDLTLRGLYGWDGSAWQYTLDGANLVLNSVTSDKMAVTSLSSISANLGTMTAGNITLDASGFIKGGAANYASGTGFWMGKDGSDYKWRVGAIDSLISWDGAKAVVGDPSGARVEADSGVLTIYGLGGSTITMDANGITLTSTGGSHIDITSTVLGIYGSAGTSNPLLLSGTGVIADWGGITNRPTDYNNLLDTSGWLPSVGHGAPAGFNINGGKYEQYITDGSALPDNSMGVVWTTYPGLYYNNGWGWDAYREGGVPAGDGDGGWNTDNFTVDSTRSYRFSVWIRRASAATVGTAYLGCGSSTVQNMASGGVNNNPYFHSANIGFGLPVEGRWYLWVGYVWGSHRSSEGQSSKGGVYDGVTGQKVATGTDYCWMPGQATSYHRAYHYYSAPNSQIQFVWPRVDQISGSEPSLDMLLSSGAVSGRNKVNASNISTFIDGLAVNTLQLAGDAVTVTLYSEVAGSGYSNVVTTSRTVTKALGSITTSSNGKGRVLVSVFANGSLAENLISYAYVTSGFAWSSLGNTGSPTTFTTTARIMRNGAVVWQDYSSSSGGYGRTQFYGPIVFLDSPGPSYAAVYTLEIVTTSGASTNHYNQITDLSVTLVEAKK